MGKLVSRACAFVPGPASRVDVGSNLTGLQVGGLLGASVPSCPVHFRVMRHLTGPPACLSSPHLPLPLHQQVVLSDSLAAKDLSPTSTYNMWTLILELLPW